MILAEKIVKLRKEQGWSQEELASRLDVSRQAVSKWESMASLPDLDKILKMSELFGVSTDYLLKDSAQEEPAFPGGIPETVIPARSFSLEEANRYLALCQSGHRKIALAVSLLIFSPVCLILLSGAEQYGRLTWREETITSIGLSILFLVIAAAVALLLPSAMKLDRYEFLEQEPISTEYGVAGIVEAKKEAFEPAHRMGIVAGVLLCILSVVPLFLSLPLADQFFTVCAVGLMLTLIAIGVYWLIFVIATWESYQKLLEEGDYTREKKVENKRNAALTVFYWCFATALYLGVSFYTSAWSRTWIVWPVAGVFYAAVLALSSMLRSHRAQE